MTGRGVSLSETVRNLVSGFEYAYGGSRRLPPSADSDTVNELLVSFSIARLQAPGSDPIA